MSVRRGSELTPGASGPARIYSLCSSAALVVNVFEYWRGRDATPLAQRARRRGIGQPAPHVRGAVADRLGRRRADHRRRARTAPTAAASRSRASTASGSCARPRNKRVVQGQVFPARRAHLGGGRLPRAQALAEDLQSGPRTAQVLECGAAAEARARAREERPAQRRARLSLLRLAGAQKRRRIAASSTACWRGFTPELDLRVLTYQTLFRSLRDAPGLDQAYLDYLARRYFA